MNPRTVCPCQPILSMISASVAPFFRWSMATTRAVLLPSRGPAVSRALAAFLALGAFLAAVAFLAALPLTGAPLAACAPALALRFAFASGLSAFGFAGSPSLPIRSQMRPTAAFALLNPFTGATPGRLFQMATRRSAGQPAASFASSFWLAKESKGVVVAAAASSAEPNAVMLLSLSIVNVVIIVLLGATLCAVTTSITPICLKSKASCRESTMAKNRRLTPLRREMRWELLARERKRPAGCRALRERQGRGVLVTPGVAGTSRARRFDGRGDASPTRRHPLPAHR